RQLVAKDPHQLERRMDLTNRRRHPLHLAVVKERPDSLLTLLELGANCDSLDNAGFTPLDTAAMQGSRPMVDQLIAHGASVRLPAAVALGQTETLAHLLRRDPDCLQPGNRWGTLIVRAAEKASAEIVAMLLQMGASPNVRDNPLTAVDATDGYTPLHAAAFHGNLPAVEVLLRCGANVRARDERYLGTPAGWAAFAGHKEVSHRILQEAIDPFEAIEMGLARRLPEILSADPDALHRRWEDYFGFTAPPAPSFHPNVNRQGDLTLLQFAEAIGDTEAVHILRNWGTNQPSGT
ncbi:MAG: ankyrin repeat domain-containing protein, partial [Bryobacterales bacterium]|nr:ankyrin repeat domain-containing protein [Bryobacterales bacterium]